MAIQAYPIIVGIFVLKCFKKNANFKSSFENSKNVEK